MMLALGGTLDDWYFGVSTLVALSTTAAVVISLCLARRASTENERRELLAAQYQARQVFAYASPSDSPVRTVPAIVVVNDGADVVRELRIEISLHEPAGYVVAPDSPTVPFVRAHGEREIAIQVASAQGDVWTGPFAVCRFSIALEWTDGAGRHWHRFDHQMPKQGLLPGPEPPFVEIDSYDDGAGQVLKPSSE